MESGPQPTDGRADETGPKAASSARSPSRWLSVSPQGLCLASCRRARGTDAAQRRVWMPNEECEAFFCFFFKGERGPFKAAALGLPLGCQTAPHARRLSPACSSSLAPSLAASFTLAIRRVRQGAVFSHSLSLPHSLRHEKSLNFPPLR